MQGPVVLIGNAGSGKKQAKNERMLEDLAKPFAEAGMQPEIRIIKHGRDLVPTARKARDDVPLVLAAGGDGTACGVAEQLVGSETAMGILPLGTFNFFARSLGLPNDGPAAAKLLAEGRIVTAPAGEVNGRLFLNNSSLGLYPAMLERREKVYEKYGRSRFAAYWSGLRFMASYDRPSRLVLTLDGKTEVVRSPMVFIAQNAYQLDQFGMQEGSELIRQGQMAVYIAPELRRMQLVMWALRMALRQARPYRDFALHGAQEVKIETRSPTRTIARDGEREKMRAPFRFRYLSQALKVLVPADHVMDAPEGQPEERPEERPGERARGGGIAA